MGVPILNGILALPERVPQLDRAVPRSRHDLTVINREGNGQHVLGVSDEAAGGLAGGEVPEAELAVP